MEKLAICSKVLYDKDIIETKNKNKELEREITILKGKNPKIVYLDTKEWLEIKKRTFTRIKASVYNSMTDAEKFKYIRSIGITFNQLDILTEITNNRVWSKIAADEIMWNIDTEFSSYINAGIWHKIFNNLDIEKIADMVFNFIVLSLGNKGASCFGKKYMKLGILDKIAYFNCRECNREFNITNITMGYCVCSNCDHYVNVKRKRLS